MTSLHKNLRRFGAMLMAMLLCASLTVSVSAERFDDVTDYAEQIDILSDIGIIVGTSDTEFSPDEDVTREQMAMLLFRTMLGRDNAGTVNTTAFNDLYDPLYNGAVSWANAAGYIIGTSGTTFEPTGGILLQDAMTMIVRALGQSNAAMDKGYPWTYIDMAVKLGLDDGLRNVGYEDTLTRAETAAILYNALTAEYLVPKTASGSFVMQTTIIEYVFDYKIADCEIVATNNYTIDGYSKVVKDGYVTLRPEDDAVMTVLFADMGLDGSSDQWLARTVKAIYKVDSKTKNVAVFGASYTGVSEVTESASVADNAAYVTIGGTRFNIVSKPSQANATNENELLVYLYGDDAKLTQLRDNSEFAAALGFCKITLIGRPNSPAEIALVKPYTFDKLYVTADGRINLAGNLTSDKLTGGIDNECGAVSGSYVLYYYNTANRRLEIKEKLEPQPASVVTKLTSDSATIDNVTYKLGMLNAGIKPADIAASLKVGAKASVVVRDGRILAVVGAENVKAESSYLVSASKAVPVYVNGYVRYAMTANIDGVLTSIITSDSNVESGVTYRYTVDGNGVYTLYSFSSGMFTQNGDLTASVTLDEGGKLSMSNLPYYSLADIAFVTDADTVIIVRDGDNWSVKKGVYTGDISLGENATVTAIFKDNAGAVETLSFMFIDGGELGRTDVTKSYVKVLAVAGSEYIGSTVYTTYSALDLTSGKILSYNSVSSALEAGKVYALSADGYITNVAGELMSGELSGYTGSTVTIGENTYRLTDKTVVVLLSADNTASSVKLSELSGSGVECFAVSGEAIAVIGYPKAAE